MRKVYAFFAEGFEEVEALMVIDLLRRTKKVDVTTVSITDKDMVRSSHGFNIQTDAHIKDIDFEEGEMIFLPGGMPGTLNLDACEELTKQVAKYYEEGKYVAAICAAPTILSHLGILKDKNATCHFSVADDMECKTYGGSVVTDGNIITANGLGAAMDMGLKLAEILVDKECAEHIAKAIEYNR